jgi:hypothetical protein
VRRDGEDEEEDIGDVAVLVYLSTDATERRAAGERRA